MKGKPVTLRRLQVQECLDKVLEVLALAYPTFWLATSIYHIFFVNPFGRSPLYVYPLPLEPLKPHAVTVAAMTSFYLYTYYHLNFLLTPYRIVMATGLTAFGVLFYDFVWSIGEVLNVGKGSFLTPLMPLLALTIILTYYGKKYAVFKFQPVFLPLMFTFFFTMTMLSLSGFYQQFHAFLNGRAPDPHNWIWATTKFFGVWMWNGCYKRRGGFG